MRRVFRDFGCLVSAALLLGLSSRVTLAEVELAVQQGTGFHHTSWSGLGAVFDLKQSSEGYLWLTTSKGVLRFDGVRFQSVEEVTRGAVHDSEIDSVFLSSSGGLWLTTQGAGLLRWKDGRLTAFPDRRCTPTRKQGKILEARGRFPVGAGVRRSLSSAWLGLRAGRRRAGISGRFPRRHVDRQRWNVMDQAADRPAPVPAARSVEVPGQPVWRRRVHQLRRKDGHQLRFSA